MSLNGASGRDILFGPFRLDGLRRALYRGDVLIPLGARALDVLSVLAASPGKLVTKDDLMAQVWPGLIVEENNIQVQVWALRKALGKDGAGQHYIVTVPGRGYRFAGMVRPCAPAPPARAQMGDRASVAVLPFTNMTGAPQYEDFADGLVEEVTTELARLRWLHVIARNSSFVYKGLAVDVRQVGRELGARYVIEGSVRVSKDRVRVTAHLIEADTHAHLWAGNFDCAFGGVLALQDEITRGIVATIEPSIRSTEIMWATGHAQDSMNAYVLYLRSLSDIYVKRPPNLARAERLLRRAIELDPTYVDALAALADCMLLQTIEGAVPADRLAAARADAIEFARRAVFIDPTNCRALSAAAFGLAGMFHRFEEGLDLAQRAVALNPASAYVHNAYGQVLCAAGETKTALDCFEEARRLSPFHVHAPLMHNGLTTGVAMGLLLAGRYDEAVKWGRRAIVEEPERSSPRRFVAAALGHLGRDGEASGEISEILRRQPMSSLARSQMVSFQPAWAREIYVDGLERAGLPEM